MANVRIYQYGDYIETYEYERPVLQRPKKPSTRPKRRLRSITRRRDNVHRLRKSFIRLVLANLRGDQHPTFVTLTMLEDLGISRSYNVFAVFIRRCRRTLGKDFKYIAVPEFQKRGAVHFHVLIWGLDHLFENERNNRYFQRLWQRGFVDSLPTDGSPRLAGYLAKYMSKALQDDRLHYQKAYVCSRNVLREVSFKTSIVPSFSREMGIEDIHLIEQGSYDTKWVGRVNYKKYYIRHDSKS